MIHEEVKASIAATIVSLDAELARLEMLIEQLFSAGMLQTQRDLLTSIPGVGKTTAARILGEMPTIANFAIRRQLPLSLVSRRDITSRDRFGGRADCQRAETQIYDERYISRP